MKWFEKAARRLIASFVIPGEIVFLEDRGGAFKLRGKHFDIRHPGR